MLSGHLTSISIRTINTVRCKSRDHQREQPSGYINRDPDVNNDIEMRELDQSPSNDRASANNDHANVYTISSLVDDTENTQHTVEVDIEQHIPEDETSNDIINGGEKPRLKRILSLIADERGGSSHSNCNNNANYVIR